MFNSYILSKYHISDSFRRQAFSIEKLLILNLFSLKRGKLAKSDGAGFVTASDLQVGAEFAFLGKTMFIYDCDDFTKQWYQDNLGMTQ